MPTRRFLSNAMGRVPAPLHDWGLTPTEAVETQRRLAERWRDHSHDKEAPANPQLLAGMDVSYDKESDRLYGGVVILRRLGRWRWETVEELGAVGRATFPYVPGLLSFREAPILLKAWEDRSTEPDGILVDGQGLAHPRRFGLACHLGLWLGIPTVGCAKSLLVGSWRRLGAQRGSRAPLLLGEERLGTVLRTRDGIQPLYVSVGYAISLSTAERWTMLAGGGYRLPEPTRRAHLFVNRLRRGEAEGRSV